MLVDSLPERRIFVNPAVYQRICLPQQDAELDPGNEKPLRDCDQASLEGQTEFPLKEFEGRATFYTFGEGKMIPPIWEREWTQSEEDHLGRVSE